MSKIDLRQAYHQIPLEESSKEVTAFAIPGKGLFQFTRLPCGLTNAPASFQRAMDNIFRPEWQPKVFVYMRRFTSTVPARGARAPNRAISNSCL